MQKQKKLPTHLTVTINCTHIDSVKNAKLDINESNLIFEYPDLYYLDLNLYYKCDSAAGNAKFDKAKKTLTIKLPILGMTEESQKVADANYAKFLEQQKEQEEVLAQLEESRMEEEAEARMKKKNKKVGSDAEDSDQENDSGNIPEMAGEGISKSKFIKAYDEMGEETEEKIEDKYAKDGEKKKKEKDEIKDGRESFLNVFDSAKIERTDDEEGETDLSGGIKIHRDPEEEEDKFQMKTSSKDGSKPLIMELSAEEANSLAKKNESAAVSDLLVLPFDWDTAERVEVKAQFIQQMDLIFLNIAFKGYNKDTDVRFALSSDEFVLEIRDRSTGANMIHRICNTLHKSVDLEHSEVQFFKDFICVKLHKVEKSETWDQFGHEITNFTMPVNEQFKSNFISKPKVEKKPEPIRQEVKFVEPPKDAYEHLTEEQKIQMQEDQIRKTIEHSQSMQASFLTLSCDSAVF